MSFRESYKVFVRTILPMALLFVSPSCNYRLLDFEYYETSDIWLSVDWSEFKQEVPTGMSVYCYPQGKTSSKPYIYQTNNISGVMVSLPIGYYDILVFNQSVNEFGSLYFEGMDRFETATAVLEYYSTTWSVKSNEQHVCYEPEWLAVDSYQGLSVSLDEVKASAYIRNEYKQSTKSVLTKNDPSTKAIMSVTFKPHNVVYSAKVNVNVEGVNNIRSVRGSITGMAESYCMSTGQRGLTPMTHALETWGMNHEPDNYNKGEVYTSFRTFGLPGWVTKAATGENDIIYNPMSESYIVTKQTSPGTKGVSQPEYNTKISGTPDGNLLELSFLLVDNKTVCDYSFPVGDKFTVDDKGLTLSLSITQGVKLPDVEPEGGGGGFQATVNDWGEVREVDVPLI